METGRTPKDQVPDFVPAHWLMLLLGALLCFEAGSMITHLIRVSVYPEIGNIGKVYNGVALAIVALPVLFHSRRLVPQTALFGGMFIYGVVVGGLHGYSLDRPYWGQIYHWLIMAFGFCFGLIAQLDREKLETLLLRFAYIILGVSGVGLALIELFRVFGDASLWAGYAGGQLLLPLGLFVIWRRWPAALVTAVVLLASGRRGPALAVLFALLFVFALMRIRRPLPAAAATTAILALTFALAVVALPRTVELAGLSEEGILGRVTNKWVVSLDITDLNASTSGRNLEVEAAARLSRTRAELLIGHGFGWSINYYDVSQHYLHISYLNYVITWGLIGSLLLSVVLLRPLRLACQVAASGESDDRLDWFFVFFLLANLLLAFTVSLLSVSFLFWVMVGVIYKESTKQLAAAAKASPGVVGHLAIATAADSEAHG